MNFALLSPTYFYSTFPDVLFQVTVHLLDDTTAEGHLLYHQEHYDLAFFKVAVDERVQPVSFADTVGDGQEALRLGREQNLNLKIVRGTVEYQNNPILDEGHHYMHFSRHGKYEVIKVYFFCDFMRLHFSFHYIYTSRQKLQRPTNFINPKSIRTEGRYTKERK